MPTKAASLLVAVRPGAGLRKSRFFTVQDAAKKTGLSQSVVRNVIRDATRSNLVTAPFGPSIHLYKATRYGTVVASKWAKVDGGMKKGK